MHAPRPKHPIPDGNGCFTQAQLTAYASECVADEREACAKLCELTTAEILLAAGEMTAQELRTVRAVLAWRARTIRSRQAY